MKKQRKIHKRKFLNSLSLICWIIIPLIVIILLILDGLGIYAFTKERLMVLGIGLLVILLPFFSEIHFKNISIKRNTDSE